jgi:hypothetical protein
MFADRKELKYRCAMLKGETVVHTGFKVALTYVLRVWGAATLAPFFPPNRQVIRLTPWPKSLL